MATKEVKLEVGVWTELSSATNWVAHNLTGTVGEVHEATSQPTGIQPAHPLDKGMGWERVGNTGWGRSIGPGPAYFAVTETEA